MTQWFSKEIGDLMESASPMKNMKEALFSVSGPPAHMAIFSKDDLRRNVVTVYFSPSAKFVAEAFGAKPCEKPSITGLGLEAGDVRCWNELFPGEKPKLR